EDQRRGAQQVQPGRDHDPSRCLRARAGRSAGRAQRRRAGGERGRRERGGHRQRARRRPPPARGRLGAGRPGQRHHDHRGAHVCRHGRADRPHAGHDRAPHPPRPGGRRGAADRHHQHRRRREEPDRRAGVRARPARQLRPPDL
ncbi:MAG: CBS domain protein, partial [uncultured Nocardioides sp.]